MDCVKACRLCLETGAKLYNLRSNSLEQCYEILTGIDAFDKINFPTYACYMCAALLKKFDLFRQKTLQAEATLECIVQNTGEITEQNIINIQKNGFYVKYSLSVSHTSETNIGPEDEESNFNNNENININENSNFDVPVECVKAEPTELLPEINVGFSSDWFSDDEPLALQKKKKKTKTRKKKAKEQDDEIKEEKIEVKNEKSKKEPKPPPVKKKRVEKREKEEKPIKVRAKRKGILKTVMNIPEEGLKLDDLELETYVTVINLTEEEQKADVLKRQESDNYKNSPYKCNICFKGFLDEQPWQHHAKKHDVSSGSAVCDICQIRFKSNRGLNKHLMGHAKKYNCNYCSYVSRHATQAKNHFFWHQGVMYKCPYCDEVLSKWTSYLSHVRIKHPSDNICGLCGYSFVSQLGLTMHKTIMHRDCAEPSGTEDTPDEPYCAECEVKFASVEAHKRHMVTALKHKRNTDNKFGCRDCGETFETEELLRAHTKQAHSQAKKFYKKKDNRQWPLNCIHCSEEMPNGRVYWNHFRRFHPDKEYPCDKQHICDVCGKSFKGNAFLTYHKRTHSTEKTFKCKECGKAFFNKSNLTVHLLAHSERRPYECSVCGKGFKCKGALNRHFRSHTGEKPYKCEVCGKAFGDSSSCRLHLRTVHLKQPAPVSRARLGRRKQDVTDKLFYRAMASRDFAHDDSI